jgi:excinuclease ABC subunit C
VPGLGEVRRKALLRHFGSLKRIKTASIEEIAEVPGVGRHTAEAILAALAPAAEQPPPAAGEAARGPATTATEDTGAEATGTAT